MSHRHIAPTPPLGWNSYDSYGCAINEQEFRANVDAMAEKLLPAGYRYVCIDAMWAFEPDAIGGPTVKEGAVPSIDAYGRLLPSPSRFPSAAGGSFAPLADYVHSKGLKFGIHVMRGVPRAAVDRSLPVLGTRATAADIADTTSTSDWDNTMYGLNTRHAGAQAYYDSILALYAQWGVDFIKADDMGTPYAAEEIDLFSSAVERAGRPIVLSISPGVWLDDILRTWPHIGQRCEMWRITGDMWDNWRCVYPLFALCAAWSGAIAPNTWPDADMLPYGRLSLKSTKEPGGRPSRLTADEIRTHFTLLCMAKSPLIMGGDLASLDEFTLSVLTNPEVLAVNQYSRENRSPFRNLKGPLAWTARMADGDAIVAIFNLADTPQEYSPQLRWLRIAPGRYAVRDLWERKDLAPIDNVFSGTLAPHACVMYRLSRI